MVADPQPATLQKGNIKLDVVGHERRIAEETAQAGQNLAQRWRMTHVLGRDACKLRDEWRDRTAGVDQRLKLIDYLIAPELYRADFDNLVSVRVQPCRFQVNRDQDIAHGECLSSRSEERRVGKECSSRDWMGQCIVWG